MMVICNKTVKTLDGVKLTKSLLLLSGRRTQKLVGCAYLNQIPYGANF